ncbi:SDR family NAD(P)-dependent oxidoreductase [Promicromonospora panici]|uniref:SDR family NAD(P)-dependent oxidoreductase n=1 Tax=Promicromonospora panici TaxID=2219658 RepID=UPI00101DCCD8|nr:SDR family oxidoreductase [Promicromonospora panici]
MTGDLTGCTALVTGAGAGIGRETAVLLARRGAAVVVNARGAANGARTVSAIVADGGRARLAAGDVADPDTATRAVAEALDRFGGLDILVNNAGIAIPGTVETTSDGDLERMLAVNVKGIVHMCRAALPALRESHGVIVNVASVAALKGHHERAVYAATKGAVVALTRSMAADHVADGVRVNCVCPGTTLTPALADKIAAAADPAAQEAAFVARQPLGRLARPDEIAAAIAYVASQEAAFMTGSVLVLDGGMTM